MKQILYLCMTFPGLIWIRQQVEWKCKHAERCEYGSLILTLTPLNGNDYNYAMAA
jgi:hypothetical protein